MPSCFLDTNIFLYAAAHQATDEDEAKRLIARRLIADADFAVSGQIMQEFYANAIKLKPSPLEQQEAADWVETMAGMANIAVDASLVCEGIAISRRYKISYWDGAVIAAANALGTSTLYSEDLNDGQIYGAVKVINPFKNISH